MTKKLFDYYLQLRRNEKTNSLRSYSSTHAKYPKKKKTLKLNMIHLLYQ